MPKFRHLAPVLAVAMLAACVATGQARAEVSLVGRYPFGKTINAGALGDTLLWGQGPVLRITDLSRPDAPRELGRIELAHAVWAVCAVPGRAYVSCIDVGLVIVDISDLTAPRVLSTYGLVQLAWGMAVTGNHLVFGNGTDGVRILDVSDPGHPFQVGAYHVAGGSAHNVLLEGSLLYVSYASKGLRIVDISNPAAPLEVGRREGFIAGWGIAKAGAFVYLTALPQGLFITDVSVPAAPLARGYFAGVTNGNFSVEREGRLYVQSQGEGVQALDVTNPDEPVLIAAYTGAGPVSLLFGRQWLYAPSSCDGIIALDTTDPARLSEVGRLDDSGQPVGVAIGPGHAYLTSSFDGLRIIDVTDAQNPRLAARVPAYMACDAIWRDGYVYLAATDAGAFVIDVHDPAQPETVAVLPGYWIDGVALAGDFAYLADGGLGLRIYEVTDPRNPRAVGTCSVAGETKDVGLHEGYAYIANGSLGLRVIDVRSPAAPVPVGSMRTGAYCLGVEVHDDLAVLIEGAYGVELYDLTNPAAPALIRRLTPPGSQCCGATVVGTRLYLADELAGLWVYDITNPLQPVLVDDCRPLRGAQRVAVGEGRVLVSGMEDGLWVLHDDTVTPVTLSRFCAERFGREVRLAWTFGAADLPLGVRVCRQEPDGERVPLSDAPLPVEREGACTDPDAPAGEALYWLQALGRDGGVTWLGPTRVAGNPPASLSLRSATPNPFNPRTTIGYSLPQSARVKLTIYDVRGARVATLVDADQRAGEQSAEWSGMSDGGASAPSGLYFARLETAAGVRTVKVTLTR